MNSLSPESFAQARQFLRTQARPLERALFAWRFEQGPPEAVVAALAAFQNDDGGFGHALEPDLRTPTSSALASSLALRLLREVECPAAQPLIAGAVRFLLATYDHDASVWRVAPLDTNDYPHAPWWHDEAGSLTHTFDGFLIIPRAEIVGSLHHFAALVPSDWLQEVTERTVRDIEAIDPFGTGGGDDLVFALRLAETAELPPHFKDRLLRRLRSAVPQAVDQDPQHWGSYTITPLKVAPSPRSPVADLVWDALQSYLDYLIAGQSAAGSWDPVWTWGTSYPDAWEEARHEWCGHLTLETLTALRAYGRV